MSTNLYVEKMVYSNYSRIFPMDISYNKALKFATDFGTKFILCLIISKLHTDSLLADILRKNVLYSP